MQGNRDNEVRILLRPKISDFFQGQKRQRIPQMRLLTVLEGVNQVAYGAFIEKWCPGGVKVWWGGKAHAAAVIAPRSDKGNSADRAEWR